MKKIIILSEDEKTRLHRLSADKSVYLKYKNATTKDFVNRALMEKFEVFSLENLLRSSYYYGFVKFKDKKYKQEIFNIASKQNKRYCRYRKSALQIGFECPEELCYFYFDIYKLKQDNQEENIKTIIRDLKCSDKINKYLIKYQTFINNLFPIERKEFIQVYNQLFTLRENNKISMEMIQIFNSPVAGIACQIRNYIDNVFPIFISDSLTREELKFINFLVDEGNSIDYIIKYNKTIDWLKKTEQKLIRKYSTKDLNELVIIHMIEKNYHADNRAYLNLLLNINIDNVLKNLKLISRLIVRTDKSKVEQIMSSLSNLKAVGCEAAVTSHHYKQLTKLLNEAINQNII